MRIGLATACLVTSLGAHAASDVAQAPASDYRGYRVLHSFQSAVEGSHPVTSVVLLGKAFLFGTTLDAPGGVPGLVYRLVKKDGRYSFWESFGGKGYRGCGGHPRGLSGGGKGLQVTSSDTPSYVCNSSRLHERLTGEKLTPSHQGTYITGPLVNHFGTASYGGRYGQGTVFRQAHHGVHVYDTVHAFRGDDGAQPSGSLLEGADGTIYGTTQAGGANGLGTIFSVDAALHFQSLHSFSADECSAPVGDLVQVGTDLYGVCGTGGKHDVGAIFKFAADSTLTVLHHFGSSPSDGRLPLSGLTAARTSGAFYGTTSSGGRKGGGIIYRVTLNGDAQVVHEFCACDGDGYHPVARLNLLADGKMYGTTLLGGAFDDSGTVFELHRPD
jgi:uncharacterized repeat protein (TIGR03803 family)